LTHSHVGFESQEKAEDGACEAPSFLLGDTEAGGSQVKAVYCIRGAQPCNVFKENIDKLLVTKKSMGRVDPALR
jgi:hypothetical protein